MFSNIQVKPIQNAKGAVKARGRVTVANKVNINISIMESKTGLFVSLPSHKGKDKDGRDKWYSDVFIEDAELYKELNTKVLAVYNSQASGLNQGEGAGPDNQDSNNLPF